MPVSRARFVECLSTAGILSATEVIELADRTTADPKLRDTDALARDLVRLGKLTKYQAAAIYQDKLDALVLGNYLIIDKLGAGGMGQVFRARHRKMDRVVALKLLPKKALGSPDAVERFQREVKAAARLVHAHIVTALDADTGGGTHFLVMEYIEGHDLSALIKKQGPVPVATAVSYLLQAARGLEHAHAEGVIHRDIKPSNLLVDKRGTVKILDMGLARFSDAPDSVNTADISGASQLTQAGNIMGTVDYMAPEQAVDTRQADERADIYSLGCTLCYLLTGQPPFKGDTMMARLVAHRDAPIPSLRKLCPEAPAPLDALFQRMLTKRPADRIKTMTEVISALEAIAVPKPPPAKAWQWPVFAGAGTVLATVVVVAALVLLKGNRDGGNGSRGAKPASMLPFPPQPTRSKPRPPRAPDHLHVVPEPRSTAEVSARPQREKAIAPNPLARDVKANPSTVASASKKPQSQSPLPATVRHSPPPALAKPALVAQAAPPPRPASARHGRNRRGSRSPG